MPRRNTPFVTNEIYHVFNRSVGKEIIFSSKLSLRRVVEATEYYRFSQRLSLSKFKRLPDNLKQEYLIKTAIKFPLVEIYAFSFMPNHYHFLLKQMEENGIRIFITNLQNSFARYFNTKTVRHGSLFQIQFKAKRIESDEQLIHVSRYIHLNHVTGYIINFSELFTYPWTSIPYYLNNQEVSFVNTERILSYFSGKQKYFEFLADQVDYQQILAKMKNLILE